MTAPFLPVIPLDALSPGEARRCELQGQAVALFHVDGCVYATQDTCTHGNASLVDGYLIGDEVECPLHQGMFNVRTGQATAAPCVEPLRTFRVEVRDGVVFLQPPDTVCGTA